MLRIPKNESPCFVINRIELRTSEPSQWAWLTQPQTLSGPQGQDSPLHQCLGTQGINVVLARVKDALISQGFVTARVFIEPQNLSSGTLVLTVQPGRIGQIRIDPSARAVGWNTVPARAGDALNLRDVEQALENFKRVPSVDADIQIKPAQGDLSDLVITHRQTLPFRLSFSLDDSGAKSTGRYMGSATFSYDNPLMLSDMFYMTVQNDLGRALEGGGAEGRGTRGWTLHYSVPYGSWLLSTTTSRNHFCHLYHQPQTALKATFTVASAATPNLNSRACCFGATATKLQPTQSSSRAAPITTITMKK